ncbi:MAG: 3-isopropylmalate dehydratase large subunit [Bacillota bacterium]
MGKTFAEKVLGRAAGRDVKAGEVVVVQPDFCMSHENASSVYKTFRSIGVDKVWDNSRIVVIFDHTVPPSTEEYAYSQKIVRGFVAEQEIKHFYDMNSFGGICHQIMCQEGYAAPGLVIVGTDSHTCTSGAMGAFATGIGRSEMAAIWATGQIWLQVPRSMKITVTGSFKQGVSAKDLILKIIGDVGADGADYMSVEFHGPGIANMSVAERMTLCNMGIEMGAKNAVCKPDEKVRKILAGSLKSSNSEEIWADDDAQYDAELVYNLDQLEPAVVKPHNVDNFAVVSEVTGTKIDQAFIGTCTNARIEDLRLAAQILKGRRVAVRTIVNPASCMVFRQAMDEGIIQILLDAGCTINHPGCGPCIGVYGGVLAEGEVCISTANRNFRGRMGSRKSLIYLASPMTVAYSALFGEIRDPREAFRD